MIFFIFEFLAFAMEFENLEGMAKLKITGNLPSEILTQSLILAHSSNILLENVEISNNQNVGITTLGYRCFYQYKNIKTIILPNGLKTIESNAFEECTSLLEINIPEGVTTTGTKVFFYCYALQNVTIPSTLTTRFSKFMFHYCKSLLYFFVPKPGVYSSSPDNTILIYNGDTAIIGPGGHKTVKIPQNIKYIADLFLDIRSNVENIDFSEATNLKQIGTNAFRETSVKKIVFPKGLEYIGDNPMNSILDYMEFPSTLIEVGNVFEKVPKSYLIHKSKAMFEENGVVYDGNRSRILLLSENASLLNIAKTITNINIAQFRSSNQLTTLIVENDHGSFWGYENLLYTANKSVLLACPGGCQKAIVWKGCTTVSNEAFRTCKVTSIIFEENSVTSIGSSAFLETTSLTSIELPDKISIINGYAFRYSGITSIKLPSELTVIGIYAFSNSVLATIDFTACQKLHTFQEASFQLSYNLETVKFPNSLTSLATKTFYKCTKLNNIQFPSSISLIGSNCFEDCSSLSIVSFDPNVNNLASIDAFAFKGCSFQQIEIPDCVTTIGNGAFNNNLKLSTVIFSQNSKLNSIEVESFAGCDSIVTLELPDKLAQISEGGLSQMGSLLNISVTDKNSHFQTIEGILFDKSGKTLVSFPGGIKSYEIKGFIEAIGNKAFFKCVKLENLTFSKDANLGSIGSYTFSGCTSLNSIEIPKSVHSIDPYAFQDCVSLSFVSFEKESLLANLQSNIFEGCLSLKNVTFMDNENGKLKEVSAEVFKGCKDLVSFRSLSVQSFGASAFRDCSSLTEVSLTNIVRIAASCFYGCSSLRTIRLPGALSELGEDSFRDCSELQLVWYCGSLSFESSVFTGTNCVVAVRDSYPYSEFGKAAVWKVLDADCEMPTARFTANGGDNTKMAFAAAFLLFDDEGSQAV